MREDLTHARLGSRWTAAYVRTLLPMLRVIEDGLRAREPALRFHEWRPDRHHRPPGPSTPPHDGRWAWDMLPMLAFSTWWRTADAPNAGALTVGVNFTLDDGWPEDAEGEPDPAKFPPAETCGSPVTSWV